MPGPPDRFELSVFERLRPVIMAIDKRALRAEERRQAIAGDLRGLTPEESAHLEAGWAKVRDAYQAAQQHLLDALERLNDAGAGPLCRQADEEAQERAVRPGPCAISTR